MSSSDDEAGVPECLVCMENLWRTPGNIQQCPSGHLQCLSCFTATGGGEAECPACGKPMGDNRNRWLEEERERREARRAAQRQRAARHSGNQPAGISAADLSRCLQEQVLRLAQMPGAVAAAAQRERAVGAGAAAREHGVAQEQEADTAAARRREEEAAKRK